MPCGNRPLVKKWENVKRLRIITPSPLEQNEASVKIHWKKIIRDLELSYKDDKFWDTQRDTVQELVGPKIFGRLTSIFNLPPDDMHYEPPSETSLEPSDLCYALGSDTRIMRPNISTVEPKYSMSDYKPSVEDTLNIEEEEDEDWSESTELEDVEEKPSRYKSMIKSTSFVSKTFASAKSVKSVLGKAFSTTRSKRFSQSQQISVVDSPAETGDDLLVHGSSLQLKRRMSIPKLKNPHFDMLYCTKSETDMIKWNSKYKKKEFEISASDEFSEKAEILTKLISKNFYEWWVGLGNEEFKSEIKRPEDVEDLFQVLFDEHASRGLVLDPKILPCVLPSIAKYVGVPKASCPKLLKQQIAADIYAETSPTHKEAFGTCLPQKLKHIPPNNDTAKMWHSLVIPEDLKTMSAVWGEISYLTSTKSFHAWLQKRPHLPMAKYLTTLGAPTEKKQAYVVPSDFVFAREMSASSSASSTQELALPVSEFTLELKDVLSKLMND